MAEEADDTAPVRPERFKPAAVPTIPVVDATKADAASVEYSHYRTGLSRHRTGLSEHRTDLSEYRTDLSTHRTDLSEHRTNLSDHRTEMAMRRTGMGLQRTRLAADRTLMAHIRTSLSLIGFGFTIYQTFQKFREAGLIQHAAAPRNFGATLIVLGVLILVGGIWRQVQFATELRARRKSMVHDDLIHGQSDYPVSVTLLVAVALLALGIVAFLSIVLGWQLLG